MGLLDGWKARRAHKQKLMEKQAKIEKKPVERIETDKKTIGELQERYREISEKRREYTKMRLELTESLDNGEIDGATFRKRLLKIVQDHAEITNEIQKISEKLRLMGASIGIKEERFESIRHEHMMNRQNRW